MNPLARYLRRRRLLKEAERLEAEEKACHSDVLYAACLIFGEIPKRKRVKTRKLTQAVDFSGPWLPTFDTLWEVQNDLWVCARELEAKATELRKEAEGP